MMKSIDRTSVVSLLFLTFPSILSLECLDSSFVLSLTYSIKLFSLCSGSLIVRKLFIGFLRLYFFIFVQFCSFSGDWRPPETIFYFPIEWIFILENTLTLSLIFAALAVWDLILYKSYSFLDSCSDNLE